MAVFRMKSLKQFKKPSPKPWEQQKHMAAPQANATKEEVQQPKPKKENKEKKSVNDMNTADKIALAESLLEKDAAPSVKRIKQDKGLFERVSTPQIILTEDNRELLND